MIVNAKDYVAPMVRKSKKKKKWEAQLLSGKTVVMNHLNVSGQTSVSDLPNRT